MKKALLLDGQLIEGEGNVRELVSPATGSPLAIIREASPAQVEMAVQSAKTAFNETEWKYDTEARVGFLLEIAARMEEQAEEFAAIEAENTGKPLREARLDVEDSVNCFRYYAELITNQRAEEKEQWDGSTSIVKQVPIGVCALIVPWNFPLLLGIWKIAPALAAGNTVVFKPSELTPLSAIRLAELMVECGLPIGVFNLVTGDGQTVGQPLVAHKSVDKISFTGGSETGRRINEQAARALKRVSLELGGKSPLLVLKDADLDKAADWGIFGAYFNQGSVCVASSRILVHEDVADTFTNTLVERMKQIRFGDPLDEQTEMGPVVSEGHMQKVLDYVRIGLEEGATLRYGGERMERGGYYISPALFTDVREDMRIVQEEVFGPFCVIQTFTDEEEAIALANGTEFGLAAGVLSEDTERAGRVADRIQAGTVWINSYHTPFVNAPWGGFKQSGIGRELGPQGLASYTEPKHINVTAALGKPDWYAYSQIGSSTN